MKVQFLLVFTLFLLDIFYLLDKYQTIVLHVSFFLFGVGLDYYITASEKKRLVLCVLNNDLDKCIKSLEHYIKSYNNKKRSFVRNSCVSTYTDHERPRQLNRKMLFWNIQIKCLYL